MRFPLRWLLLLTVVVAIAWYAIAPRRAYDRFLEALVTGSEAGLHATVDFPVLRDNLRDDLAPRFESAAGGLGNMVGGALLDRAVSTVMTPAGLSQLITGFGIRRAGPEDVEEVESRTVTSYRYRSPSRVDIRVRSSADPESAAGILTFTRSALTWRLTRITSDALAASRSDT